MAVPVGPALPSRRTLVQPFNRDTAARDQTLFTRPLRSSDLRTAKGASMSLEHEGTSRHRAYVLRMWCVNACAWRFSLVDAETGQKRGFPDLAGLVAFLEGEMERGAAERAPSLPAEK